MGRTSRLVVAALVGAGSWFWALRSGLFGVGVASSRQVARVVRPSVDLLGLLGFLLGRDICLDEHNSTLAGGPSAACRLASLRVRCSLLRLHDIGPCRWSRPSSSQTQSPSLFLHIMHIMIIRRLSSLLVLYIMIICTCVVMPHACCHSCYHDCCHYCCHLC